MLKIFAEHVNNVMTAFKELIDFEESTLVPEEMDWETVWAASEVDAADLATLYNSLPSPVKEAVNLGLCWIAGGHIRRWIAEEPMDSDIDLFFRTVDDKRSVESMLAAAGFKETFRCPQDKLTTFAMERGKLPPIFVQCISERYYTSPQDTINTFDFTMAQFAFDGHEFFMGPWSLLHLSSKVLRLHSLPYPAASMRRMMKFAQQGYWLPEETALDFITAIATAEQRISEDGTMGLFGGQFTTGRPAGLMGDEVMRWYID